MNDPDELNSAENSHATTTELAVSVNIGGHECELQFEVCGLFKFKNCTKFHRNAIYLNNRNNCKQDKAVFTHFFWYGKNV